MAEPAKADEKSENKDAARAGPTLAASLKRLNDALDALEEGVDARAKANPNEQLQRMADDRARLGRDLDAAKARADRLKEVNAEVSRRLVGAMEMVRAAMQGKG